MCVPPEKIVLNGPLPYIDIRPRADEDGLREVKTESSYRQVPLVALEVFQKHPKA